MAIEDILSKLPKVFGTTPEVYRGLLDAPERASLENRANIGGLLGFAGALAQGMSPQGYRRSAAQNILTALGAGYGAAGQTYDAGLNQVSNVMKLAQAKRQISGLATLKAAHPDLAYLADVSPDEFVRIVSARERAKMYGLTPPASPAPSVAPVATVEPVPAPAASPPATGNLYDSYDYDPIAGQILKSSFAGGRPSAEPTARVFDETKPFAIPSGLITQAAPAAPVPAAPAPVASPAAPVTVPSAAVPSPAATVPAPSAAPTQLVSPKNQAEADRLFQQAVLADSLGDKFAADEFRRRAEILSPKEQFFYRDGVLVSSKQGKIAQYQQTEILNSEEAAKYRLPTEKGQVWQRDPSGKISRIEGTESTELDKAQLIKTLPGQFANVYPTLQSRANNLIARASTLTKDQINKETEAILDADSKILADLDPKLQAAEMARRKSGATVLYPPGAVVPGKEGQNIVDKELLTLGAGRMQLQGIAQKFDPKYLTAGFKVKMKYLGTKEFLTGKLAAEDQAELSDYAAFSQDAYSRLNSYINEVTGAAVGSGEEEARIRKGVPDPQKDSPTEFLAKLRNKIQEGRLFEARLAYIKSKGLKKLTDVKVDDVPRLMREREDQIYRENKFDKKNKDHQEIVKRVLAREFGLLE